MIGRISSFKFGNEIQRLLSLVGSLKRGRSPSGFSIMARQYIKTMLLTNILFLIRSFVFLYRPELCPQLRWSSLPRQSLQLLLFPLSEHIESNLSSYD
jgi:hypothetical protein